MTEEEIWDHEQCTRRHAQIARKNAKFLSSQKLTGQCIAEIAGAKENHSEQKAILLF